MKANYYNFQKKVQMNYSNSKIVSNFHQITPKILIKNEYIFNSSPFKFQYLNSDIYKLKL